MISKEFEASAIDPFSYIRGKKVEGEKVVGYLLPDVPTEMVHAAGATSFLLTGGSTRTLGAGTRLQTYACSICRRSLAWAMEDELDFMDGMVLPITCDTTRTLAHIWRKNCKIPFFESLLVPRIRNGSDARGYLRNELIRFKKRLEGFLAVEISDESLRHSISIHNDNRRMLRGLYGLREQNRLPVSNVEFHDVVRSSFIMPKEEHNRLLRELLSTTNDQKRGSGKEEKPIRLYLSGKVAEPRDVFAYLDSRGCSVVADDFWDGFAAVATEVGESDDPLDALVNYSLSRVPFSVFFDPMRKRIGTLVEKVKSLSVDGAVFLYPKYCEPLAFDYPEIRKSLQSEGIQSILIELEFDQGLTNELRRRLDTFSYMVESRTNA